MEAKVNHLYEQNKHISTGAVADREKGHTSGDMATCLCSCCTIVYGQVQKSRESGCDEALALEMYTAAVVAKVMVRRTNASWLSRAYLSHKVATRTKYRLIDVAYITS